MGGSTGSGNRPLGGIGSLEKKAKEVLSKGKNDPNKKNTFLSFDFDDKKQIDMLRATAKNPNSDINFIDRSVKDEINSDRADYIKQKITEKINQCSQTVVYISNNTPKSDWVNWEVKKSLDLGKKVIAVYSGDSKPTKLPSSISGNKNIKLVAWKDLPDYI